MSFSSVLAFMLSCAERLFPNYLVFARCHGWGDPEALQEALDIGWQVLSGGTVNDNSLDDVRASCEAAEPNTEEFDSIYVSPGLDAAVIAGMVIDFVRQKDESIAAEAALLCRDTVDMYVQELEGMDANAVDLEVQIQRHPLMQRELARQRSDVERLSKRFVCPEQRQSIEADWRAPSVSNIGLRISDI